MPLVPHDSSFPNAVQLLCPRIGEQEEVFPTMYLHSINDWANMMHT